MKGIKNSGFTLVELLVVITILSIISVVAYQSFGGATDKAIASRKINDISTIETALQQFRAQKNYYPMPMNYDEDTNIWWYNSWATATPSNTLRVTYNGQAIDSIVNGDGGWIVYGSGAYSASQIWAKWVIGYVGDFGKNYLSKELYDPEIGDIKVGSDKTMIDFWIGRYTYSVYALPRWANIWNRNGNAWSYYNIATTIKQKDGEIYETYIVWDYDNNACGNNKEACPETLIGTLSWATSSTYNTVIKNKSPQNIEVLSDNQNQGIPYPVNDFAN